MTRSNRTQMYLDLAKLSLELERNQMTSSDLVDAMVSNPHSPYYDSAKLMFNKLKATRDGMYDKETECLMTLCGKGNAVPIGNLEVSANGKVVAVE